MKKIAFIGLLFVLALPFSVSALQKGLETTFSTGFEFGNTIERQPETGTNYFGSPGANIESYSFWNGRRFGLFFRGAVMHPFLGEHGAYDYQASWMIGPAFRLIISKRLTLQTGLGIGSSYLVSFYEENGTDYTASLFNLGVGADTGLKFDITDAVFIKGGVNVLWGFLGGTNASEGSPRHWNNHRNRDIDRTPNGYWELNVNPYISIGMNIFAPKREPNPNRTRLGKPSLE